MKLTTIALSSLVLSLVTSPLVAGPGAGKAAPKPGGSGTSAGMSGQLRLGEAAIVELDAPAGEVRIDVLVERDMELEIGDLKQRNKRSTIVYTAKPRTLTFDLEEATRLQIRIARRPAGPFHHLPARLPQERAGFVVKVQAKPAAVASAGASKSSGLGLGALLGSGDASTQRGPSAGVESSKSAVKSSH